MSSAPEDRWLLPRRQTEYPTWELVSEAKLHGRREATFLALAALSLVAITALVLSSTRIIDLSAWLASVAPDVESPLALAAPLGVVPFAIGLVAVMLACELYGRRRALALVVAGAFASAALIGLARVADLVGGGDATLAPALALAAGSLVGHLATVLVFDALRRRTSGNHLGFRAIATTLFAQTAAWVAFGGLMYAFGIDAVGLAVGSGLVTIASIVVATLPLVIVARVLTLFLRVARRTTIEVAELETSAPRRRLQPALIVDDPDDEPRPPGRARAPRASIPPYSSDEMRFFTDGDQLGQSMD